MSGDAGRLMSLGGRKCCCGDSGIMVEVVGVEESSCGVRDGGGGVEDVGGSVDSLDDAACSSSSLILEATSNSSSNFDFSPEVSIFLELLVDAAGSAAPTGGVSILNVVCVYVILAACWLNIALSVDLMAFSSPLFNFFTRPLIPLDFLNLLSNHQK